MDNSMQTLMDKPIQKVGSAFKYHNDKDQEIYNCEIKIDDLFKGATCIYKNKESDKNYEEFILSLVPLKKPTESATHLIFGSLEPWYQIDEFFVDIRLRLDKNKMNLCKTNDNGLVQVAVVSNNKDLRPAFFQSDFKVINAEAPGSRVLPEVYLGYADRVVNQSELQRPLILKQKAKYDFIGSGFIVQNETIPGGQALIVSTNKERIMETSAGNQPYIYVSVIPTKNNPIHMVACLSKDGNDNIALYTLRLDAGKVRSIQPGKEGSIKFSCYFDDSIQNDHFNLKVIEYRSKEKWDQNTISSEIGLGADKEHRQMWPNSKNQQEISNIKEQGQNVVPKADIKTKSNKSNLNL